MRLIKVLEHKEGLKMDIFQKIYNGINTERARSELANSGWTLLDTQLEGSILDQICAEIDLLAQADGTEVNYGGSEHRVWSAHEKSELIDQFRFFSDKSLSEVVGSMKVSHNILAIRNRTLTSADVGLREGRWHLDSFNQQLKMFVFLTEVTLESGPLEMIPGTHALSFKMREALKGHLITPKDLVVGTRQYSRLKDTLITKILSKGYETKVFTVPAGTIALVDTSCVHRARPCVKGERYALTSYY